MYHRRSGSSVGLAGTLRGVPLLGVLLLAGCFAKSVPTPCGAIDGNGTTWTLTLTGDLTKQTEFVVEEYAPDQVNWGGLVRTDLFNLDVDAHEDCLGGFSVDYSFDEPDESGFPEGIKLSTDSSDSTFVLDYFDLSGGSGIWSMSYDVDNYYADDSAVIQFEEQYGEEVNGEVEIAP